MNSGRRYFAAKPNPHDLLMASAAGDEVAFGALYDLLAPQVYALILQVLPDAVHADRVMTDALVEVWRTARSFDARRNTASGWVCAIAHHHAVRRARALQAAAGQ